MNIIFGCFPYKLIRCFLVSDVENVEISVAIDIEKQMNAMQEHGKEKRKKQNER